jgi:hypothetical protein
MTSTTQRTVNAKAERVYEGSKSATIDVFPCVLAPPLE